MTREVEAMPLIKNGTLPTGNLKGEDHGASISLILDQSDPGHGPRLHRHPYDETWVVIEGSLTFQSGDERLAAGPGDIVIVRPGRHTSSPTTAPAAQGSSASTPTRPSTPNGSNEHRLPAAE
jgi:mannose-6-phosphate isomerase-like protein (cupin superfamily)